MATDIVHLLDHLGITAPINMVGHDIGGMIAYNFAALYSDRAASVVWGECPLPGTTCHEEDRTIRAPEQFHFIFHCVPDLAEALVMGKEEIYLSHFFDKLSYNRSSITEADLAYYIAMYKREGALRCAFRMYQSFLKDADECSERISKYGKCKVKALALNGSQGVFRDKAPRMMAELHMQDSYIVGEVSGSGHYIAEENPEGFVEKVVDFIK
jgi:pimeloyl-ACP methyl ester carboxylesterase